jgi:hypothetical protein
MAKLIVNPTSASRREIPLQATPVSIGRDPSNDLVLPDSMVSRRHAVIEQRGTEYFVRDCNSSNGSLLNGDRITECVLKDGDLMAIGATRLLFRDAATGDSGEASRPPAPSAETICPQCKAPARGGGQFCHECGASLVAQVSPKMLCPSCGTVVTLPARFCNVCGSELPRAGGALDSTTAQPVLDEVREDPPKSGGPPPVTPGLVGNARPRLLPRGPEGQSQFARKPRSHHARWLAPRPGLRVRGYVCLRRASTRPS